MQHKKFHNFDSAKKHTSTYSLPMNYKWTYDECKELCEMKGIICPSVTDLLKGAIDNLYKELSNEIPDS